jgi:SAM-dependent methyltransferase
MDYEEAINKQYGMSDLGTKILNALKDEGIDTKKQIQENLASIEDLHIRGRSATMELIQEAGLNENTNVLDVGCGIGGPARAIVTEFGCNVTGLDLCKEFCDAAEMINNLLGLDKKIEIRQGNALDMPFDDESFDFVMVQHVLMNIKNKDELLSQIHRVLHPQGRLALYEICAGLVNSIYFPVMWANDLSISFLVTPNEFRQLIKNNGFKELSWKDNTAKVLEGYQTRKSKQSSNRPQKPQPINYNLVFKNLKEKGRNTIRNFEEGRIIVIQGLFEHIEN